MNMPVVGVEYVRWCGRRERKREQGHGKEEGGEVSSRFEECGVREDAKDKRTAGGRDEAENGSLGALGESYKSFGAGDRSLGGRAKVVEAGKGVDL